VILAAIRRASSLVIGLAAESAALFIFAADADTLKVLLVGTAVNDVTV
jgi:hypothetical protein